jgi:uncharacterized membrane protein YhaH (DUF805 family)
MTVPAYGQPQSSTPTDPSDAPIYGISFGGALARFFKKYARFTGRASLSEFWWMFLWNIIISAVLTGVFWLLLIPAFNDIAELASRSTTDMADQNALAAQVASLIVSRGTIGLILVILVGLGLLIPHLALTVRRLHDSGRSGHFAWFYLVPSVGSLIVLILCLMPTDPAGSRYDRLAA